MSSRSRGFTLIELMIAMSLFLVLGTALVALLSKALDFLDTGTTGSEIADKAADFTRQFRVDVENVVVERGLDPGSPEVRFLSDYVPLDTGGIGRTDYWAQRVAFVRSTRQETADKIGRVAGTKAGADAYIDGKNDRDEADLRRLKAPGGMQEVLYMAVPENKDEPGLLTLYRGVRSPVGGKGSLLDRRTVRSIDDLKKVAQPLLTGVLHFEVRFWSGRTRDWEKDSDRVTDQGPCLSWDSTRGILEAGLKRNEFPFARGTASLADPRDDVSPRALRVLFVFELTGSDVKVGRLIEGIDEQRPRVVVDDPTFATLAEEQFLKVGTEWMSFSSYTGNTFAVVQRGTRGTERVPHKESERVRAGFKVERVLQIPAFKEDRSTR